MTRRRVLHFTVKVTVWVWKYNPVRENREISGCPLDISYLILSQTTEYFWLMDLQAKDMVG